MTHNYDKQNHTTNMSDGQRRAAELRKRFNIPNPPADKIACAVSVHLLHCPTGEGFSSRVPLIEVDIDIARAERGAASAMQARGCSYEEHRNDVFNYAAEVLRGGQYTHDKKLSADTIVFMMWLAWSTQRPVDREHLRAALRQACHLVWLCDLPGGGGHQFNVLPAKAKMPQALAALVSYDAEGAQ